MIIIKENEKMDKYLDFASELNKKKAVEHEVDGDRNYGAVPKGLE